MTTLLKPVRFDLIGASERTRNALVTAFAGRAQGTCELARDGNADAVIVDLDGVGARVAWSKYRHQYPNRPSVLLAMQESTVPERAILLIKPIRIEALMSAVDDVRRRMTTGDIDAPGFTVSSAPNEPTVTVHSMPSTSQTVNLTATVRSTVRRSGASTSTSPTKRTDSQSRQAVATAHVGASKASTPMPLPRTGEVPYTDPNSGHGSASIEKDSRDLVGMDDDVDVNNIEQMRRRFFDPEGTIVDWARRATMRSESMGRPVIVNIQQRDLVLVDFTGKTAQTLISEEILKANCTRRFTANQVSLRELDPAQAQSNVISGTFISLEALQWKLALWTYQGRLPAGTPVGERVYLRRWPNFTRLLMIPDAMRIAALLVDQPLALPRVAEALAIPQRHVFAFYGAALTAGLASQAKREADKLVASPVVRKHVEHGFINRVVDRLKQLVA
ncbi:MAG: hypothetical protein U1F34_08715 [Gammaproteobacteria bacterium]